MWVIKHKRKSLTKVHNFSCASEEEDDKMYFISIRDKLFRVMGDVDIRLH